MFRQAIHSRGPDQSISRFSMRKGGYITLASALTRLCQDNGMVFFCSTDKVSSKIKIESQTTRGADKLNFIRRQLSCFAEFNISYYSTLSG